MTHVLYLLSAAALALIAPQQTMTSSARLFVVVGAIGLWRYGWLLLNLGRAVIYAVFVYPRMKSRAEAHAARSDARPHAFFLITTYRIEQEVTLTVYRALFAAALNSPHGATIVASVVDREDERLITSLYQELAIDPRKVRLEFVRIDGTGKRDALAYGLRAIAGLEPGADDIVVLVDGDSCVPRDIVARSAPFLISEPRVGALTTDEIGVVEGDRLFRDWFALRFAQRQMMMCSMGLSRRVLTLTGRMSVFAARVAVDPDFIRRVQHDAIDHWRLGEVRFLTGDDKSTWFWLLRNGYHMLYLPDVRAISLESQPKPGFIGSARALMVRWYGNTLRNNGRALRLGPARIGYFTWWSILDQRLSLWTTLTGPVGAVLGSFIVDPFILPLYLAWVMATRYATCAVLTFFRGDFRVTYPFLLYFSQVYGAMLKAYVFFHPNVQKWTRQNTVQAGVRGWRAGVQALSSYYMHALAVGFLVTAVGVMTDLISIGAR